MKRIALLLFFCYCCTCASAIDASPHSLHSLTRKLTRKGEEQPIPAVLLEKHAEEKHVSNHCKEGYGCRANVGECCPPNYNLCCRHGCGMLKLTENIIVVKCKPRPPTPAQEKWFEDMRKEGEKESRLAEAKNAIEGKLAAMAHALQIATAPPSLNSP